MNYIYFGILQATNVMALIQIIAGTVDTSEYSVTSVKTKRAVALTIQFQEYPGVFMVNARRLLLLLPSRDQLRGHWEVGS